MKSLVRIAAFAVFFLGVALLPAAAVLPPGCWTQCCGQLIPCHASCFPVCDRPAPGIPPATLATPMVSMEAGAPSHLPWEAVTRETTEARCGQAAAIAPQHLAR
jgi:hypothetical protein